MAEWGQTEDAPAQPFDRPDPNDGLEGNRLLDSGTTAQHLAGEAFFALCGTGWLLSFLALPARSEGLILTVDASSKPGFGGAGGRT